MLELLSLSDCICEVKKCYYFRSMTYCQMDASALVVIWHKRRNMPLELIILQAEHWVYYVISNASTESIELVAQLFVLAGILYQCWLVGIILRQSHPNSASRQQQVSCASRVSPLKIQLAHLQLCMGVNLDWTSFYKVHLQNKCSKNKVCIALPHLLIVV